MNTVIVDSSALVALLIENDADHEKAVLMSRRLKQAESLVLVPAEVISETLNLLGKMQGRAFAVQAGEQLLNDPYIHPMTASTERLREAVAKWNEQASGVSYTDCVVMAAADEAETPTIYGFDEVFAKNGYHVPSATKKHEAQ